MLERLIGDWREATAAEIRLIAVAVAGARRGDCVARSRLRRRVRRRDEPFRRCECVAHSRRRFFGRDLGAACALCCVAPPSSAGRLNGEGAQPLAHRRSVGRCDRPPTRPGGRRQARPDPHGHRGRRNGARVEAGGGPSAKFLGGTRRGRWSNPSSPAIETPLSLPTAR